MRETEKAGSRNAAAGHGRLLLGMSAAAAIVLGVLWAPTLNDRAVAQAVDLDEIFWCDPEIGPMGSQTEEECLESRGVLLASCTTCHSFAPIVLGQKSPAEWDSFLTAHRDRVSVSEEEFEQLREFISTRFTPDNPVPELPEALRNYTLPPA